MAAAAQHSSEDAAQAPSRSYRFPRAHHLKQRRLIRPLFDRRRDDVQTVAAGCVRLLFRRVPRAEAGTSAPLQIGFAPGRQSTAVARNRIRRILREVYRVHQHPLVDLFVLAPELLTVMVLFRGNPARAEACIPQDLPRALRRLVRQLEATPEAS